MKTTTLLTRFIVFMAVAAVVLMYLHAPDAPQEALNNNLFWAILGGLALIAITALLTVQALQGVLYKTLAPDAKERYDAAIQLENDSKYTWIKATYAKMLGDKPMEEEHEIILDHNYDGIQELDNNLPPWWVYGFYATIIFAVVYMVRFHIFNEYTQDQEYDQEVAAAQIEIEEWKKTAKDLVDVNSVILLTDASDLTAGQAIFSESCVACHKADGGGGIGPNLTDLNWILGGGIKNVFHTISEGGRSGKGMVPWKNDLKPAQIAQVASYVLSLQGSAPAEPKEPEGDIWVDENSPETTIDVSAGKESTPKE